MRRGLEVDFVGRTIVGVHVGRERVVRRTSREELVARLSGRRAVSARRRGKYLLCDLDSGDELMIHLRMSGQVRLVEKGAPRPLHCHVVLDLAHETGSSELHFVDPRTFGEVIAFDPSESSRIVPELERLGPDPIVDDVTSTYLDDALSRTRRAIKVALLDQHLVAGIGNIYGDEILHRARLNPNQEASSLGRRRVESLRASMVDVLTQAIELGGSTLRDARYVDVDGRHGGFQEHHLVYARAGLECLTCGKASIETTRIGGRSSCWCPRCQPIR